jgi:hypothetical protein
MQDAALQGGWQVDRISHDLICPEVNGQIAAYGDGLTARLVAEKYNLKLVSASVDWLLTLPQEYVHRRIEAIRYEDLRASVEPRFIKCTDTKWFYPGVFIGQLPEPAEDMPKDEVVLVQEPVSWLYEFRYFILDREIRASCQYKLMGKPSSSPSGCWITQPWNEREARDFLNCFLKESIDIPEATVIDVGKIEGRGLAIVEANPAYGSGIYDCNPRQVLEVVERACRNE